VKLENVPGIADALVAEKVKPTIERVCQRLGGSSPNTMSAMLDEWFARESGDSDLPLSVVQATFRDVARLEADQVQVQATEATRSELELQREALA
jgi:hypothetical protein